MVEGFSIVYIKVTFGLEVTGGKDFDVVRVLESLKSGESFNVLAEDDGACFYVDSYFIICLLEVSECI